MCSDRLFCMRTYLNGAGTDSSAFSQLAMDLNKISVKNRKFVVEYYTPTFKILK